MLALALLGAEGHVSMIYQQGQPSGIRNANGATGNGRASVQSPCGGATTFGSNGVGTLSDGGEVTLAMRYAAGHNGNFRLAYACGGGSGTALEAATARVGPRGYDPADATVGCDVTGADSEYPLGGGGATAIGQSTMTFTCKLPTKVAAGGAPQDCTLGILDQRDWGGCVDVNVVSAADPLPPGPPPAPYVSSIGSYALTLAGKVDTGAGQKASGLFQCCALVGTLSVPAYAIGAPAITASLSAQANGCPSTTPGGPPFALPPPPNTATIPVAATLNMGTSDGGNRYSGTALMAGQQFEFGVSAGKVDFVNVGADQPIICDGISSLDAVAATGPLALGDNQGASLSLSSVALVLAVMGLGVFAFLQYRKRRAGATKPPPTITMTNQPPPPPGAPPGPPSRALPAGWSSAVDPASGVQYYINTTTGTSQWAPPSDAVTGSV